MSCPTNDDRPGECAKRDGKAALAYILVDMRLKTICQGCGRGVRELAKEMLEADKR